MKKRLKIFGDVEEIIRLSEMTDQELSEYLNIENDENEVDQNGLTHDILQRSLQLLSDYYELVGRDNEDGKKISELLHKNKKDIILFSAIFKNYFAEVEGGVDFSEIKGLNFERLGKEDLDESVIEDMIGFANENWSKKGKSGERMVESLRQALSAESNSTFYVLRRDGKIISFMRFDDEPDKPGHKYAASFNVDPDYKSSGIGRAMHFTAFENEAKKHILDLIFFIKDRVGTMYVEGGCLMTGINEHNDFFTGTRDLERSKNLKTLKIGKEFFVELYQKQKGNRWEELVKNNEPVVVFKFDVEKENGEMIETVKKITGQGYVGTRYFYFDPEKHTERYFVFEKE